MDGCTNDTYVEYNAEANTNTTFERVGDGLCTPLGIRVYNGVYNGNSDNDGTTIQQRDNCATACLDKKEPEDNGPWSDRGDAVGFGMNSDGRCYCQHETLGDDCELHPNSASYYEAFKLFCVTLKGTP